MTIVLVLAAAYVIGGIPMGVIIGKVFYKKDIRQYGSGNIGMANAFRTLGPLGGVVVLAADIAKGASAVLLAKAVLPVDASLLGMGREGLVVLAGALAIFGASYSVFLKLSGGKSVGAATGVVLAVFPLSIPFLVVVWIAVVAVSRYISAGGIAVALTLPILVYIFYTKDIGVLSVFSAMSALVIYRHRSNIGRIIKGSERRFSFKPNREEA
ncbi:MAG: glycerol-3-phosphate acyltransferase [Candidatus Aquicultorales bacterium]